MSTRAIYCPGANRGTGAWIGLGAYVKAVKMAKSNPDAEFKHTLTSWAPGTGRDIVREFWRGVEDRINQAIPWVDRGKEAA